MAKKLHGVHVKCASNGYNLCPDVRDDGADGGMVSYGGGDADSTVATSRKDMHAQLDAHLDKYEKPEPPKPKAKSPKNVSATGG